MRIHEKIHERENSEKQQNNENMNLSRTIIN